MKKGDMLLCKRSINVGMKGQGIFYFNRFYEVDYVGVQEVHMIAENGGRYLFFPDDYDIMSDKRKMSNCFYNSQEMRKKKLERIANER